MTLKLALAASTALLFCGCTKASRSPFQMQSPRVVAFRYLTDQTMPDGLTEIPPPPATGTPAMARDEAARLAALKLQGTARYRLAAEDAERTQDGTNRAFECAFGMHIDAQTTPVLYKLLGKLRVDVRAATYVAKSHYKRVRPWVANHARVCTPSEQVVRDDGSYPSARGAVGWAYAEVLADLNPARSSVIIDRGREFGESRVVCDAEWQSDVDAGRAMAAAVVRRLRSVDQFRSDFAAARQEVSRTLRSHSGTPLNCASEQIALAQK